MNGRDDGPESLTASASLFDRRDREKVRNYARFVLGSVRRHWLLFFAVLVFIMGGAIGSLFALPKTYHVEAKALAQRNSALAVRGDGPGADSLTRVAAETILQRDNLVALIQETDLLRYTQEHRAPVQRWSDAVAKALHLREDSEADRVDALVELLEKKLVVWTTESESTVTIAIDWSDAPMACRLVDSAQRAFLDTRYAREITALAESIGILQGHTTNLKADIDDAVGAIERMRAGEAPAGVTAATSSQPRMGSAQHMPASTSRVSSPQPELEQLRIQIAAKQRAIDEFEEYRRHRLSELQGRLAEARTTYTENHPAIMDLKQLIAALSADSPQAASLRQEAASLRAEYERAVAGSSEPPASAAAPRSAQGDLAVSVAAPPPELPSDVLHLNAGLQEDRNPGMVYARGQLRDAMDKYSTLRTQIESAEIDLETAKAAFKYRYSVVTPAHLPKKPAKPNALLVILVGVVASILCALLSSVLIDVLAGKVLERWQMESLLDQPILGEVAMRRLKGPELE
jgi:uncharacterized protein involved in exopolysaccharide biosynthesis